MPKVCFFGIFDPEYARNRVLIRGFKENGYEVTLCRVDPKKHSGITKYFKLIREYRKVRKEKFEHVIVAFPGHTVAWLAYVLFGREIIFDMFLSMYNSNVEDRKVYGTYSVRAIRDWMFDWISIRLSQYVLLDTHEHIKYVTHAFSVKKEKCIRVLIGADSEVFTQQELQTPKRNDFTVHFHGNFIPLQGIPYIIDAAKNLQDLDITFSIIGEGASLSEIKQKAQDLGVLDMFVFHGRKTLEEVAQYMSQADLVLGIFGDTNKTQMVIPNKVYEAIAQGHAVISGNTPAIREVFTDTQDIVLCDVADSKSLAGSIRMLYDNFHIITKVRKEAYQTFVEKCAPQVIVKELLYEYKSRKK